MNAHKSAQISAKKKKSTKPEVKAQFKALSAKAKQLRQRIFLRILVEKNFNISKACKAADVPRRTFYDWRRDNADFREQIEEVFEARVDAWEECLHKNIVAGSDISVIFGLKTKGKHRGYGDQSINEKVIEILGKVLNKEVSPRDAAYQISMLGYPLPEALRIEVSKIQPDPPPPEIPASVSDEELEAKYQEQLKKNEKQEKEFVPQRQEEVRQIKEELKSAESFGPDAEYIKK